MTGGTVNFHPLEGTPATVTTRLPEVAPSGTGTMIVAALQLVGVATVPLKLTVLAPCVAPKSVPEMVTLVPGGPELGEILAMPGVTVKFHVLLATPPTVTITPTVPGVLTYTSGTVMLVALQLVAWRTRSAELQQCPRAITVCRSSGRATSHT